MTIEFIDIKCINVRHISFCPFKEKRQEENRLAREETWNRFVDDMKHKQSCVENTFEEKEEELREFYSDLERKLHIHK